MPDEEEPEEVESGELKINEYDYLLNMPLWSLSEEKVAELNLASRMKKQEHENLEGTHIHTLWEQDLQVLEETLFEHETKEEEDRKGVEATKATKKGAAGKKPRAKPSQKESRDRSKSPKPQKKGGNKKGTSKSPKPSAGGAKPAKKAGKKPEQVEESKVSPETGQALKDMSLRERLAVKAGTAADKMPVTNSLYDAGFGGGNKAKMTQPSIQSFIGKKRRKDTSSDEEESKTQRARDPPQ